MIDKVRTRSRGPWFLKTKIFGHNKTIARVDRYQDRFFDIHYLNFKKFGGAISQDKYIVEERVLGMISRIIVEN
jgi:hypothetical protein